jgi:aspartate-semialdehyde dehydrogenase
LYELDAQMKAYAAGQEIKKEKFPHQIVNNVFAHNSRVDPASGYNEEEIKVMQECRKIFGVPDLRVSATCVRVPVLRAQCIAMNEECEAPLSPAEAREILSRAPGVRVVDELEKNYFPMPVDASGKDDVLVGRIRKDVSDPTGATLSLFVAGDQLRKGAALNAVQIAERLIG